MSKNNSNLHYFGNPNFGKPSRKTKDLANNLSVLDGSTEAVLDDSIDYAFYISPEKVTDDESIQEQPKKKPKIDTPVRVNTPAPIPTGRPLVYQKEFLEKLLRNKQYCK
jgi:hypothetical protein